MPAEDPVAKKVLVLWNQSDSNSNGFPSLHLTSLSLEGSFGKQGLHGLPRRSEAGHEPQSH